VLGCVLGLELVAVVSTTATSTHLMVSRLDWIRFAVLAACAITHIDLSRGIDRVRQLTSGPAPSLDTKTVWSFAAVLILPVTLAAAMVVVTQGWAWLRVWRGRRPLYRWIYSTAAIMIATQFAAAVLAVGPGPYPGVPTTIAALGVVLAAAAARWLVNYALVIVAILISSPNVRGRQVLHNIDERILEIGAFGLGIAAAGLVVYNPLLLVGVVLGLIAMHRGILIPHYRKTARTDTKTGLHTAEWWHEIGQHALDRANADNSPLAVLMLDLDHFKQVNDSYGHLAGDAVLRAVARAICAEVRDCDAIGRWGGEEFVVLIPDADATAARPIAERLRRCITALVINVVTNDGPTTVHNLTVSIGIASHPAPGFHALDDLLLAADTAVYRAKAHGRDRICQDPEAAKADPPQTPSSHERNMHRPPDPTL
jgi:diguanylate cyclase (GGDEF)-like protein